MYIVEAYRDEAGKPTHRIVEKLGKVSHLAADDADWRAKAEARVVELTAARQSTRGIVAYDLGEPADPAGVLNAGWLLADAGFDQLGLSSWLRRRGRELGWTVDVESILRFLVVSRLVWPGSKRATVANADRLWAGPGVSLDRVYRALDYLCDQSVRIQSRARAALAGHGEKLQCVFYDVTNYFFEIDQPDAPGGDHEPARGKVSRRRGWSKEHRQSPIVQMGLFMDQTGMPVSYRLFHGSTPDASTLQGALSEFKQQFAGPKVTVVADSAMNNQANLAMLDSAGDGWILAASIRQTTQALRDWVLDPNDWSHQMDDDGRVASMTKSKIHTRTIKYKDHEGRIVRKKITEKVVAHWSGAYAAREQATRAEMAAKATALISDPSAFKASNRRGVKKYVKTEQVDPSTGLLSNINPVLSLDQDKLAADSLLDGYWLLHTSQVEVTDAALLNQYRQLWRIEENFRVSKTDLHTRPVYVWTPEHVEAHFLICFLALVITRVLQQHAGGLPAGKLCELLTQLVVTEASNGIYLTGRPTDWDTIDQATGVDTNHKWVTTTQLRAWRRAWTGHLTNHLPT